MVLFDVTIAAVVAFAVGWLIARQRPSEPIAIRMLLTLASIAAAIAAVLLATDIVPADAIAGALAIALGGLAGQSAAHAGHRTT